MGTNLAERISVSVRNTVAGQFEATNDAKAEDQNLGIIPGKRRFSRGMST